MICLYPEQIRVDPERFQFKAGADEFGAGLALRDCRIFDLGMSGILTVWYSPSGDYFVINGHHRLNLALRTGYRGQLRCQVLESQATGRHDAILHNVSIAGARMYGALINISEGRGTPLDAAKLMRDGNLTAEELAARGLSLCDKLMFQAAALANLDQSVFQAAVYGRIEVATGVLIGSELPGNHEAQREIYRLAQQDDRNPHRMDYLTDARLIELIRLAKNAPVAEVQDGLFGGALKENLLTQKAELLDRAKKALRSDASVFGIAVRHSGRLEEGGTIVDRESGQRISTRAARMLDILNRTAYSAGTSASEVLNEYARALHALPLADYAGRRRLGAVCTAALTKTILDTSRELIAA